MKQRSGNDRRCSTVEGHHDLRWQGIHIGKGKSRFVSTFGAVAYRALTMLGLSTLSPMFRIRTREAAPAIHVAQLGGVVGCPGFCVY